MRHPVGLQPLEEWVAVPRLDDRGNRICPRRALMPENAESKERRNDPQAQALALAHEVLDRGADAVARPALPLRRPLEGYAATGDAGFPWGEGNVAGQRLA